MHLKLPVLDVKNAKKKTQKFRTKKKFIIVPVAIEQ
jgi:hypothetical protein